MNILHIYASFESSQGGPPVAIKYLALSQVLNGHKVSIITSYETKPNIPGVKIINVNYLNKRYSIPTLNSALKIQNYINKNDIIHLHGMWNGLISTSAFFAKKSKSIITPHGMAVKRNIKNKPLVKIIYYSLIDKFLFKYINGCHYLSKHEYLNSNWIFKGKKSCIQYNRIDTEKIKNYISKNKKKNIFDNNNINLVYLGRFNEIKNIKFQIELMRKINNKNSSVMLYLIGPNNIYKEKIKSVVKSYKLEKFVKFKNPVFGDRKYLILNKANFVLLTSHYECNSVLAIETLSSGGVLLTNKNCNLNIFFKKRTCIVSKNKIDNFIKIILNYNNNYYKLMRKNAIRYSNLNLNYKLKKNLLTVFYKKL